MPNFRSIGPFKQKLQTIPICKEPGLFKVEIMQGITNLTQDVQRTWVGIERTQITRMCSFWFLVNEA